MLEKNLTNALACGFCVSENTGYFLDKHSAENHPHELTDALVSKAADWLRPYADLGKRLRAFKEKFNFVKKHIAKLACDGEEKLVTNNDMRDYFYADEELKLMWEQHDKDIESCYSFLESYNKLSASCKKLDMSSFGSWYVSKLIAKAEKDFVPLYFDDTATVIKGVVNGESTVDYDFYVEKCKLMFVYFVDIDSDETRKEPIYFNKIGDEFETVDEVRQRFLDTWKGIYNPNDGVFHSEPIEFERKVKLWKKQ